MTLYRLDHRIAFPDPRDAEESGLLAIGGDLRPERLHLAYKMGIFPWFDDDTPYLWHSPDPRMVLIADELVVNRSLTKTIRRAPYRITLDTSFQEVVSNCASRSRPEQDGTWITEEMIEAYCELHRQGLAHSVEAWEDEELVGGLYGVSLGAAFFGESMFALRSDASKIAFVYLVRQLQRWGIGLVDCQVHTEHLERFGATEWSRERFLTSLATSQKTQTRLGPWRFG